MKLVLATRNRGKLRELQALLGGLGAEVSSLADRPGMADIAEDGESFLDNARKKAREVGKALPGFWVLADDSGLVVEALGGAPGVISARYGGAPGDAAANNEKLLRAMEGVPDGRRAAAFVCCMVLKSPEGREWSVEGRCGGEILRSPRGSGGFGYDPLFSVPAEGRTMAELPMARKNEISHRGRALRHIRDILVEIFREKADDASVRDACT